MAGLVLIDSLGSFRVPPSMRSTPRWLQLSLEQYGLRTTVCVVGGARFVPPMNSSGPVSLFEELLTRYQPHGKYAWCLLVSGGNDLYVPEMAPDISYGIVRSMNAALTFAPQVCVVFGGSSKIWHYHGEWAAEYDRRIEVVMKAVACPVGARIITGATELALDASDIVDRIGHVRYGIGAMKVIEALAIWSYTFEARAKL